MIRVVDGDTLDVRLTSGRRERVQLVAIDAPERVACFGPQASARTRSLARGERVQLIGDRQHPNRDRFGRLLAYVQLPNRSDLGLELVRGGFARTATLDFDRWRAYLLPEDDAQQAMRGFWYACPPELGVRLTDAPDPVLVGRPITYTLTAANTGTGPAVGNPIVEIHLLSQTVQLGLATATGNWKCGPTNFWGYWCDPGPSLGLEPNARVTVRFVVTPTEPGVLTATATVSEAILNDHSALNNLAHANTTVNAPRPTGHRVRRQAAKDCHPSYPSVCIPPPPNLACGNISSRNFTVIHTAPNPDPHNLDGDRDGIGCEA